MQARAAGDFRALALKRDNRVAIMDAGGLPCIAALAEGGATPQMREDATVALRNMAADVEIRAQMGGVGTAFHVPGWRAGPPGYSV